MAQSLSKIILHLVFSTKDRRPFLKSAALRDELNHYIGGILLHLDCQPIIVGTVEDHIHILCKLSRTTSPATLVQEIKRASSIWLKTKGPEFETFAWQGGYGIFSLGQSQIETARAYIAGQEEHHRQISFQDELRHLLARHDVNFDERYLWD